MGVAPFPAIRRFAGFYRAVNPARVDWRALAFGRAAMAEQERWALWLPVGLGAGIGIYFALPSEPSLWLALACMAAALLAAIVAHRNSKAVLRASFALLAAVLIGFGVAKLRTEWVSASVLMHKTGPAGIDGRVEFAQSHGKGARAVITLAHVDHLSAQQMPERARISVRSGGEVLEPGAWVHLTAVLMPPPEPASPGDYDFGRAAYYLRLGAVGYAYGKPRAIAPLRASTFGERIDTAVEHLRWNMSARIHRVLPGGDGAIAAAIITGDRGRIAPDDEQALRDSGLAHVLAIAGLHMALVGLGLFWAVRAVLALFPAIALNYPIKKWAAGAALFSAGFYLIISGASAASTRAFVMLAMMLIAILFDRPALSMRALAFAATIILLTQPESLLEPGFQMSFAAVASLIAVAEWERTRPQDYGPRLLPNVRRYLRGIAMTSLIGSLATTPYAAYHFDRATHYSVLGNLGAMPIMGFVTMPAAAISVILMPFGLDRFPLHVMGWGIDAMLAVGRWVSDLPGAISIVPAWPVSALILISLGGLWLVIWRKTWRWLGLAPMMLGLALILANKPPDILVARDGETVAVRLADGKLRFLRPPKDDYSATSWLKRDGDDHTPDKAIAVAGEGAACDYFGCRVLGANGMTISTISHIGAMPEDCASSDIVISAIPTRHWCKGPKLVIDRFDVARNGAYAIWLGKTMRVETAQSVRGTRPWSTRPKRRRRFSSGG
jgi:competence protein ComEC